MFRRRKFILDDMAKQAFLDHFEKNGLVGKAARHIGTTSRVVNNAIADDEEFRAAYEESGRIFNESLEEEIYRRGVLGVEEPVFYKGEECGTKTVYSDTLLVFQTKANIEKYGDKSKQDINITGGVLVAAPVAHNAQAWFDDQAAQKQLTGAPDNQLPEADTEETDDRIIDIEETSSAPF